MGAIKAKEHIWYVGVQDPDLRVFDIIMHSDYGTSYNAYLVQGTEKTVLFETSKAKFFDEFLDNIRQVTDPAKIDYIVVDHTEPDHTGSMEKLLELAPNATVLGSGTAITFLKEIVNRPFNAKAVSEKDRIDLGGLTLTFLSVPMLHWPDSMMTYLTGDAVLFSNDAFGQHYCDEHLFNDEVDQTELFEQCQRYYANILTPFSRLVTPKITEILGFNLPVDMIATSHGVVWRDNPTQIVELYLKWAADYQEDRITIFYDTMSNNTRMMADAIAQGIAETDPRVAVKNFQRRPKR